MLYARIRYALIFLFLGLGTLLHLREGWYASWYLYVAAALLLLTYLLFGNVWSAFNLLKRGKPEEAGKLLDQIWFPRLLLRRNRAYYHFSRGMIHLQNKELEAGEKHLLQADKLGLDRPLDKALLNLNLAHIYYLQKRYDHSRTYLEAAKAEEADDLLVRQNVSKLEKALATLQ
jgi:Flp pilus assembly protein TadD